MLKLYLKYLKINKNFLGFFLFSAVSLSATAEECWRSFAINKGPNGYLIVDEEIYEADGDISHQLTCKNPGPNTCLRSERSNFPGPPGSQGIIEFVPSNHVFSDINGNPLNIVGSQVNSLILAQCQAGNFSGTIILANGDATITFNVAGDFSSSIVKHLEG